MQHRQSKHKTRDFRLAELSDLSPPLQICIVHWPYPAYVEIPEYAFARYHVLQGDWMESYAVVVVCSVEPMYNDEYVRTINCTDNIGYSMQILKFFCEFIHDGGWRPYNKFLQHKYDHGSIELRDCQLTSGKTNHIQIGNALHRIICGQSKNRDNHLNLNRNYIPHVRIMSLQEGCKRGA